MLFLLVAMVSVPSMADDGYTLVWSDEFNGTSLNTDAWNVEENGDGGGNNELQYYSANNVSVNGGCLVITSKRESSNDKSFTSGRINSLGKTAFKYGKIEARIKLPYTANGLWPAFWMLGNDMSTGTGWPMCGEIDIMEMGNSGGISAGTQKRFFSGALHWGPSVDGHKYVSNGCTPDYDIQDGNFHLFTLVWTDSKIDMYVDLDKYPNEGTYCSWTTTSDYDSNYFSKQFGIVFNVAVGGNFTGIYDASGITALSTDGAEQKEYVDYVRVYQKTEDDTKPAAPAIVLGDYASKSLDADGHSTFNYTHGYDYVIIDAGTTSKSNMTATGNVRADYSVGTGNNILNNWWNSYTENTSTGANSIGVTESYRDFTVGSQGWSGLGFTSTSGKDLSMLDNSYYLHFALKGTDNVIRAPHKLGVGGAWVTIGATSVDDAPVIGDFNRDGEWYSFDIPFSVFMNRLNPVFETSNGGASAYNQNAVSFVSGGTPGTELQFDNVFFYRKSLYLDHVTSDGVAVLGGVWNADQFATIDAASKATAYDFTSVDGLPTGATLSTADPNAMFIVPASGKFACNEVVKNSDGSGYAGTNIRYKELYNDGAAMHDVCTAVSPITATSPTFRRTYSSTGIYSTTVVPFDVASLPDGVVAYEVKSYTKNGTSVLLFDETKTLAKGKPYLIYNASTSDVQFTTSGQTSIDYTLTPVTFTGGTFKSTYTTIANSDIPQNTYIFTKNALSAVMNQTGTGKIPSFRSYVQLYAAAAANSLNIQFDDETGIHDATAETISSLFNVYSIDGSQVKKGAHSAFSLPKGVYVINGKKVVVK